MDCKDGSRLKQLKQYFVYQKLHLEVAKGEAPSVQVWPRRMKEFWKLPHEVRLQKPSFLLFGLLRLL